jgi:capsular polysaccharide transport system permease protein
MFGFTEYIVKFMQRFLYFTSGVFFAIERLPQEASSYVQWNPVLHIMHMLRADFFPQMPLKPEFSNLYFVYFLIPVLWIMGMTMTKKFMKYILEDR